MRTAAPIVVSAVNFTITRDGNYVTIAPSTWTERWWRGSRTVSFLACRTAVEVEIPRWLTRHGVVRFDTGRGMVEARVPAREWRAVLEMVRAGGWRKVTGA